jgi:hypothetical protein
MGISDYIADKVTSRTTAEITTKQRIAKTIEINTLNQKHHIEK